MNQLPIQAASTQPGFPAADIPSLKTLQALVAPENISSDNLQYVGDAATISLSRLSHNDVERVKALYILLSALYRFMHESVEESEEFLKSMTEFLRAHHGMDVLSDFHEFGTALKQEETEPALRKALHDIRGGSLIALFMHLELLDLNEGEPEDCTRIYILTRDHLKMMRNILYDLDTEGYENDLRPISHGVDLLKEKWANAEYLQANSAVKVVMECRFEGSISERCMEFSSLDRVLYNLINNAAKYTTDGLVHFRLFALDDNPSTQVRFVIHNRITEKHRDILLEKFGNNLNSLFEGGFTTGGHGVGMRACADFVVHGYGLKSVREALESGYLGIRLIDDYFVAWFHWPGRQ